MTEAIADRKKAQRTSKTRCTHRWIIKTPNGAKAPGRCKLCGLVRKFATAPERLTWGETRLGRFSA